MTSATTERASAFVATHRDEAEALGHDLAEHLTDPDALATSLHEGFARLADSEYLAGQQFVAPAIGPLLGVRWPLLRAVASGFRAATRDDRPANLLYVADRLFREEPLELRWFAFSILERTLPAEPERTWQLLRRGARDAGNWITVDTLARPYGKGVLLEHYRWAELEQLVFSPSRWERRLVGSTIATIPHVDRRLGRTLDVVSQSIPLLAQLMGDAEPDVQKALAWAYRSLAQVDRAATTEALAREAAQAATTDDGHRAWVVRDALTKLDPGDADAMRRQLGGIRRRSDAPSTSTAAETAARFADLGLGRPLPEPPL